MLEDHQTIMDLRGAASFLDSDSASDLTIKFNDGSSLKVHKTLLARKSDFFNKLLKYAPDMKEYVLSPDLVQDGALLQLLFKWFNNEESVVIDAGNAPDMLSLADFYGMAELMARCRDVMVANLDEDNCIQVLNCECYYPLLQAGTMEYIASHFSFIPPQNFTPLPLDKLKLILNKEDLKVRTELSVWNVIKEWFLARRGDQQSAQLEDLLPFVRFGLLSFADCQRLEQEYREITSNHNHPLLNNAHTFQVWKHKRTRHEKMPPLPAHMTILRPPLQAIVATGGNIQYCHVTIPHPSNRMELYDLMSHTWFSLSLDMPGPRYHHGCVTLGGKMYVIGGTDGTTYCNTVFCLDLKTLTWAELAPMRYRRCFVATVVCRDNIYAMGGHDGTTSLKTCERFDPSSNSWTDLPDMIDCRSEASAVVADGQIWIVGGCCDQYLRNAEMFDVCENRWRSLPQLAAPRGGVGCALIGRRVYAIGGRCSLYGQTPGPGPVERHRSVESLDIDDVVGGWTETSSMRRPRSNFGICSSEGRIFVAGGHENSWGDLMHLW